MVITVRRMTMADDHNGLKSAAILLLLNLDNSESTSSSESNREVEKPRRRVRRRYNQILRRFCCSYPQCNKSYGSLNHLNAHIVTKKHGQRKSRADFQFNEDVVVSPKVSPASQPYPQVPGGQPNGYQPTMGWPSRREQASGTYWYGMPVRPTQASEMATPTEPGISGREPPARFHDAPTGFTGGPHFQHPPRAPPHAPPHGGGGGGGGAPPHPPPQHGFPGYVLYSAPFSSGPIGPPGWQPPLPPPTHLLASHHYLPPTRDSRSSSTSSSKLPLRTFPSPPLYPAHNYPQNPNPHPITLPPVLAKIPSPPSLPPLYTNEVAKTQDNGMQVSVQPADSSSCSSE